MSSLNAAGSAVRAVSGPFGMGSEVQMMRRSAMLSMPLSTIARRLPRL